jgi:hypothetical protein
MGDLDDSGVFRVVLRRMGGRRTVESRVLRVVLEYVGRSPGELSLSTRAM